MNDNPIQDLLDAMDAITKPVRSAILQDELDANGTHVGQKLVRRVDPPLLRQLRLAITGDLGSHGNGGKAAHERTPFDVTSFTMYEDIDGRVRSWLLDAQIVPRPGVKVEGLLRQWFPVWTAKILPDGLVERHTAILTRWASSIRDLLEPPTKQELTDPCPLCGQMWAVVGSGEEIESVRALWAVWRRTQDDSYGLCRACDHMWRGIGEMRRLRILLDEREAEKTVV